MGVKTVFLTGGESMKNTLSGLSSVLLLVMGGNLVVLPAMADKPEWAGKGKGGREERSERRDDDRGGERRSHFEDRHRVVVREYYENEFHGGRCPPGLAKKHNGCMPPGQARKWQYGRPLPRDVVYYEVPREVVVRIGVPPPGYRYVRVAQDILMIAVATGMVMDAIEDLGR
jgi:Ni/Co efflux regulator RcnB